MEQLNVEGQCSSWVFLAVARRPKWSGIVALRNVSAVGTEQRQEAGMVGRPGDFFDRPKLLRQMFSNLRINLAYKLQIGKQNF